MNEGVLVKVGASGCFHFHFHKVAAAALNAAEKFCHEDVRREGPNIINRLSMSSQKNPQIYSGQQKDNDKDKDN